MIAVALSVCALADYTVNKPMYEAFYVLNSDASSRTNCDLTKFSTKTWINDVPTPVVWTFTNQSSAGYDATTTPASAGEYKLIVFYNNTAVGTFTDNVRLWDVDTTWSNPTALRLLGLCRQNIAFDSSSYNSQNQLLSMRMRLYTNAADARANSGNNVLAVYSTSATFANGKLSNQRIWEVK